jgi:YVTN family beta-propeller protein
VRHSELYTPDRTKYTSRFLIAITISRMNNLRYAVLKATVLGAIALGPRVQTILAQSISPSSALLSSRAVVFNPATRKVYAVDKSRDAIFITNQAANLTSSVRVGREPVAIAVNPATNRVYVANAGSGTVSVVDGQNDSIFATVSVGALPYVLAVSEVTNRIYVSNTFRDLLTIIDGTTNTTKTVKTGSADAIAIDSKAGKVYLLGYEDSNLNVLDEASGELSKIQIGMHAWSMALNQATNTLYVTLVGSAAVVAWDEKSRSRTTIPTGAIPCAVAVNPLTNTAYVVNYQDNSVTVIDGARHVAISTVRVGEYPQAIAVDSKANLIYVANTHGNSVTVIDGTSNAPIATLNAGKNPYSIVANPNTGRPSVANLGKPSFMTIAPRMTRPR